MYFELVQLRDTVRANMFDEREVVDPDEWWSRCMVAVPNCGSVVVGDVYDGVLGREDVALGVFAGRSLADRYLRSPLWIQ